MIKYNYKNPKQLYVLVLDAKSTVDDKHLFYVGTSKANSVSMRALLFNKQDAEKKRDELNKKRKTRKYKIANAKDYFGTIDWNYTLKIEYKTNKPFLEISCQPISFQELEKLHKIKLKKMRIGTNTEWNRYNRLKRWKNKLEDRGQPISQFSKDKTLKVRNNIEYSIKKANDQINQLTQLKADLEKLLTEDFPQVDLEKIMTECHTDRETFLQRLYGK